MTWATRTDPVATLRRELRAWLVANLPWAYGRGLPPRHEDLAAEVAALREFQRRLADAGFVGVAWPTRYGGRGLGPLEHHAVQEELARARAPELVGRIGVNLVAPTLLAHGTEAQRLRFLPRIRTAEELWCQLFSEPDAGSDLASLATRALRSGDGWRLFGRKVWTSYAQFADFGLCLARSDPEARGPAGLTMFVVPMHQPGVQVHPLVQATGDAEFNEVVLDGAFVPEDHVVGAEGQGWRVARATLGHERGVNVRQLVVHLQRIDELFRLAVARGALDHRRLARRLASRYAEVAVFRGLTRRALARLASGRPPGAEASAYKLYWSEASQRLHDTALDVLGEASPLWRGASSNPGDGEWQRAWVYSRATTIFAGTSEIHRNLVAERVLGLPRERPPDASSALVDVARRGERPAAPAHIVRDPNEEVRDASR
jgi:alkylation response protein AidB-like acyl-CoA dehydrogenase